MCEYFFVRLFSFEDLCSESQSEHLTIVFSQMHASKGNKRDKKIYQKKIKYFHIPIPPRQMNF